MNLIKLLDMHAMLGYPRYGECFWNPVPNDRAPSSDVDPAVSEEALEEVRDRQPEKKKANEVSQVERFMHEGGLVVMPQ